MSEEKNLVEEVASGETLRSLVALRDYVAHELQGNRCKSCEMSQLRTGDTAALVLRLQKIIEDIAVLNPATNKNPRAKGGDDLAAIRARRALGGTPASENSDDPKLGTKKAARRQGARQPRFRSD